MKTIEAVARALFEDMKPIEAVARALFDDMKQDGGTYDVSWEDSPKELQNTFMRKAKVAINALADHFEKHSAHLSLDEIRSAVARWPMWANTTVRMRKT